MSYIKELALAVSISTVLVQNVTAQLPSWGDLADQARWAANAHNVQSWQLIRVPGKPWERLLVLDPSRLLPQTDPPSRQLTISLGAFLAVMEESAAQYGARVTWTALPDRPGARVSLSAGLPVQASSDLDGLTAATVKYHAIPFTLPPDQVAGIEARSLPPVRVRVVGDKQEVTEALEWARRAYRVEMETPRTRDESIRYTVYGARQRKERPWGISLVPNFPTTELFWVESFSAWFPPNPQDYAQSAVRMFERTLSSVNQLVIITCQGDTNRDRLKTGEVLERVWLAVRRAGGELLPLSQGLEEFPEMDELRRQAHARWAQPGETVQMVLAVLGPGPGQIERSPRLSASEILGEP